jgi:anti-sigma B factor antagonist
MGRTVGTLIACMPLEITTRDAAPGVVVVALAGKLMLGSDGADIPEMVDAFLREGKKTIVFDLSGVTTIDSTGIGRFIAAFNKIVMAGGDMRMAGATGHLFQSFHISLLDQVFPFFDTADEAVKG